MKKILVFFLCIVIFILLFLCYDRLAYEQAMYAAGLTENNDVEEVGCHLEVRILERKEDSVLVTTTQDYPYYFDTTGYYDYMFYSTDILEIELKNTEVRCELLAGKVVDIVYVPAAGTTGRNPIYLNKVECIEDVDISRGGGYAENIITYKGRRFDKARLSKETIQWLELSEEEKKKSEYIPKDLKNGRFEMDYEVLDWGVEMNINNITATGLNLIFTQKDFIPTIDNDNWEYSMTSEFVLEKLEYKSWHPVKTKYNKDNIPWSSGIQIIDMNNSEGYYIDWEWLYGELKPGTYRIVKELKVLKGTHDYQFRKVSQKFIIEE